MVTKKRIIIQLHIKNNSVVKGIRYEGLNALCNPTELLEYYSNNCQFEILINDVVATLLGRNGCFKLLEKLNSVAYMPVIYQGGIKSLSDIENALKAGADRVAINTSIYKDIDFCELAIENFGSSTLIASVDYVWDKSNLYPVCLSEYGRQIENRQFSEHIKDISDLGFSELILGSVDHDGMGLGFDKKILDFITNNKIPILLSGGCGSIKNITDIFSEKNFLSGVIISSITQYSYMDFLKKSNPDGTLMVQDPPFDIPKEDKNPLKKLEKIFFNNEI